MKKAIISGVSFLMISVTAFTQGCVIVRNISGFGHYNFSDKAFSTSEWLLDVNARYFESFRDFKGTKDQMTPETDRSINNVFTFDITATRLLKDGWSLSLNVPIISSTRSTTIEHGGAGKSRHSTQSFGVGDVRFAAYRWLVKPDSKQKLNIQVGLGLKLPTGNYQYEDYFFRKEDSLVRAPVNPSIQLGDGGTGITTEINTYYMINDKYSLYANLYYMINPRDVNGTSSLLGRTATATQIKSSSNVNTSPDQYTGRIGLNASFNKVVGSLGIRAEGIPVYDVIGGSNGNRRAGYNISLEPGIIYNLKRTSLLFYAPIMIKRETLQSVPDKIATKITGTYTLTQGGFADYLIFVGVSFKL